MMTQHRNFSNFAIMIMRALLVLSAATLVASWKQSAFNTGNILSCRNLLSRRYLSSKKDIPTTVEGWKTILNPNQFAGDQEPHCYQSVSKFFTNASSLFTKF